MPMRRRLCAGLVLLAVCGGARHSQSREDVLFEADLRADRAPAALGEDVARRLSAERPWAGQGNCPTAHSRGMPVIAVGGTKRPEPSQRLSRHWRSVLPVCRLKSRLKDASEA